MKFTYAIMAALLLAGNLASAQNPEIEMRSSLRKLAERYRIFKYSAADEISLACLGEVYNLWYRSYEPVLKASFEGRQSQIEPWVEAASLSLQHEIEAKDFYPIMRPNLMPAIRQTLEEARRAKEIPALPAGMSTAEIFAVEYDKNLSACQAPTFREAIAQLAPVAGEFDANAALTLSNVTIRSEFEGGTSIAGGMGLVGPKEIGKRLSVGKRTLPIAEWLVEIQAR